MKKTKTKTKTEKHGNYLVSSPLFLHKKKAQYDSRTWQRSIFRTKNCSRTYRSSLLHSQFFFPFLVMCQLFKCSFYFDIHSRHEFRRQWKSGCWRWKKKEKKQEKQNVTCILQTRSTTDRERRREIKNTKWRKILTCNNWTGRERVDLSKVD